MIIKLYVLFSTFFLLLIIFSYYTIISIFSFLGLLLILCSLLFFLNIEFMSFLLLFIYMSGILIFFLFSSLMLNMQFNVKKYKNISFYQLSILFLSLILSMKFLFLFLYYLIGIITYFQFIFSYNYLPLCFNNGFSLFKSLRHDINSNIVYLKNSEVFFNSGYHFDTLGLLSLYEQKWFLLFLIGFILFTVLLVVSTLCLKKCIIKI